MKHRVKITVIDKKLYPELQRHYCADPNSGACSCYNVGDEFIFESSADRQDFWHMGLNTLTKTSADPSTVAGGPQMPHCSKAWDSIFRYIHAGLQGRSIMNGLTKAENMMNAENIMITCCNDFIRPVIFKVERLDYKLLKIEGVKCEACKEKIKEVLESLHGVKGVELRSYGWAEVFVQRNDAPDDELLKKAVENLGKYTVIGIE